MLQIRRANQRDAAAIELLIREAFREHKPAYTREAFDIATPGKHEIEKRIEDWAVWIAINANVTVGTVSATPKVPDCRSGVWLSTQACGGTGSENCCSRGLKILPALMVINV